VETSFHSPIYSNPWPYGVVLIASTGITIKVLGVHHNV